MSIASSQTIQPPFLVTVVIAPEPPATAAAGNTGSVQAPAQPPLALVPPVREEEEPTWEDAEWR